jgi:hypothetical protein
MYFIGNSLILIGLDASKSRCRFYSATKNIGCKALFSFFLLPGLVSKFLVANPNDWEVKMKFSDFFVPKIVRSDPKARIDAVNKTSDTNLLQQVIKLDQSEEVREAAAQRLRELQETV